MPTILLVDDDVDVRKYVAVVLQETECRLLEASDGAEGLRQVRTEHPDLVIADLLMPTMNGFELVRQMRMDPESARIPVIFMTGFFKQEEGCRLAEACGAHQLLAKPCGRAELIQAVGKALGAPSCQVFPGEDLNREHLQLLTNTLVAKVRELETVNQRIEQQMTELKRAEQALRESHALLHAVVESIPEAVYVKDVNGRYLMINSPGARLIDKDVPEVLGRDDFALFEEETARLFMQDDRRVMESGGAATYEHAGTAAGVTRTYLTSKAPYLGSNGEVRGILGISRDITRSKAAQAERELLLEKLPLAAYTCDAEGLITYYNQPAVELWGRVPRLRDPGERFCGSFKLFSPNGAPIAHDECWMALTLHTGQAFNGCEVVIGHEDGSQTTALAHVNPLRDECGMLIGAVNVVVDITERKRGEQAQRESAGRLQALSRRLLDVQEAERRHLARELHDEVGQLLTGLRLLLRPNGDAQSESRPKLEHARALVDQLLERVRGLSFDLRPAVLDQLGFLPALLELFDNYTRRTGVLVEFRHKDVDRRFAADVETTAYRIVQEALTNVARHAGVGGVTVRVWATQDLLSVQVEDRGRGFDPDSVLAAAHSNGLAGMRERARLLGGQLTIDARPGDGTHITAELPVERARGEDAP